MAMRRQEFWGRKHELYTGSPKSPRLKKARQVKSKVKSMLIIFFDMKGIVHKESILAGQTVNSVYYCDIDDDCMNLATEELAVHHDNSLFHISSFIRDFFLLKSNMTGISHPPNFSLFPLLKIKLKGRRFDTVEMMEEESQAVLNTPTEHDFQDAFKKWQKRWEGNYFKGDGGQ
jgi:hypothetical protein